MFNLRGQIQKPGKFRATQSLAAENWNERRPNEVLALGMISEIYLLERVLRLKQMDWRTQNTSSVCFTCNNERFSEVRKIFDSITNDKLWTRSAEISPLFNCSVTSFPSSGKCVPCVEDHKFYIVCLDMLTDVKLDLEDGVGNYLSNTEATCPRLKTAGAVSPAGHNNPIVLTIFFFIGAGFIIIQMLN